MIEGVKCIPLVVRSDDRGDLIEILRANDPHFTKFGQVYFVRTRKAGTIRAFHRHKELYDWFYISHGMAKFILWDDNEICEFVIGEHNPCILVVPPGVYHGWMALVDNTHLISTASEVYNRENPDEERVSPYRIGTDMWGIKAK